MLVLMWHMNCHMVDGAEFFGTKTLLRYSIRKSFRVLKKVQNLVSTGQNV